MSLFLRILTLLGSLGMFLYGMSLMSGGLQKMAGDRLRTFMAKMTSNTFKCILTGIVVTALVQSSTATTLIVQPGNDRSPAHVLRLRSHQRKQEKV